MRQPVVMLLGTLAAAGLGACGERPAIIASPQTDASAQAERNPELEELHRNIKATRHNDLRARAAAKSLR